MLQVHGRAVTVPGRALAGIIASLKTSLEPDCFELLQAFHQQVVSHLRAMSTEAASATANGEMQDQLAARLGALKSMVGAQQDK